MSGDLTEHQRDRAQRQVVAFDLVFEDEPLQLRDQSPVTADDALEQALVSDDVQTEIIGSITDAGREHDRQIARMTALEEAVRDAH